MKDKVANPLLGIQHRQRLELLEQRAVADSRLVDKLLKMPWPQNEGAYIDLDSKKLRFQALDVILSNGRPFAVLDEFRPLIEGDGSRGSLTDSNHLANLMPMFKIQLDLDLKEKRFCSMSLIFDGLSEKGSWVSILCRGVLAGYSMQIEQHLLDMPHTSSPYNHAVLNKFILVACQLIQGCGEGADPSDTEFVRFLVHDDAEVNNKSCDLLIGGLFYLAKDISCICHVLYRIGERTAAPLVEKFESLWLAIFKNADKRRNLFRQLTQLSFPSFNKIKVPLFNSLS